MFKIKYIEYLKRLQTEKIVVISIAIYKITFKLNMQTNERTFSKQIKNRVILILLKLNKTFYFLK